MTLGVSQVAAGTALAVRRMMTLAVVVALAGCSGGDYESATVVVPCSTAIAAVDDIDLSYGIHGSRGGFVALPSGQLHLGRTGEAGSEFEGFRFSKFGLLVRRDRTVSLEVVDSPGEAVLEYVHPDTPTRSISVGPCTSELGEWAVFAGGAWVTEPGCVEVVVASGDEEVRVRLPVGQPCDPSL